MSRQQPTDVGPKDANANHYKHNGNIESVPNDLV